MNEIVVRKVSAIRLRISIIKIGVIAILLLNFSLSFSQIYFPMQDFRMADCNFQKNGVDKWRFDKFSESLKLLKEPSLFENNFEYPVYRFLWMPSFDTMLCITIHLKNEDPFVTWTKGYFEEIAKGSLSNVSTLTTKESGQLDSLKTTSETSFGTIVGRIPFSTDLYPQAFDRIMNDFGFWKDDPMGPCIWREGYLDGSEWLFEARQSGKYKFISRSNPGGNSKYFLLGLFFFKSARFNKDLDHIY